MFVMDVPELLFRYSMLDKLRRVHTMNDMHLKSEIAQQTPSDLQRKCLAL